MLTKAIFGYRFQSVSVYFALTTLAAIWLFSSFIIPGFQQEITGGELTVLSSALLISVPVVMYIVVTVWFCSWVAFCKSRLNNWYEKGIVRSSVVGFLLTSLTCFSTSLLLTNPREEVAFVHLWITFCFTFGAVVAVAVGLVDEFVKKN